MRNDNNVASTKKKKSKWRPILAATREQKVISQCMVILTLFVLTIALAKMQTVLIPLSVAFLMFIVLMPLTDYIFKSFHCSQVIASSLTFISLFTIIIISGGLIYLSSQKLLFGLSAYSQKFKLLLNEVLVTTDISAKYIDSILGKINFPNLISEGAMGLAVGAVLVFVFLVFLLYSNYEPNKKLRTFSKIQECVSNYIWLKFLSSFLTGLFITLFFLFLELELAITFGLIVFVLNFIPSLGSIIATLLPLPIAYMQFGLGPELLLAVLVPGTIQMLIGNIIEPHLMGERLGMHPIAILASLIFWGIIWGLPGMFLAVPVTASLNILFANIPELKFINYILSGNLKFGMKNESQIRGSQ